MRVAPAAMIAAMLALCVVSLSIGPSAAQDAAEPTPEKESFVIQPGTIDSGARGVSLRFVANDPGAFSTSSSKPPEVEFSSGVTLVSGTFQVLNQNEAKCTVDVEDSTVGTVEVGIKLFSVNGTSVRRTLRATLGVKDEEPVSGSNARVGAESIRLVRVNVEEHQQAGAILISGETAGIVTITAPTGTTFAETPVATIDNGDINTPQLQDANTTFRFGIGNPALNDVKVRVGNIMLDTALYDTSGGGTGDLACEVAGGALSNQSVLVVNAFTGKSAVEGENDVPEEDNTGSQSSSSSDESESTNRRQTGGARISDGNRRSLEDSRGDESGRRDESERNNRTNFGPRRVNNVPSPARSAAPSFPVSPSRGASPASPSPTSRPAGGGARPVAGGRPGDKVGGSGRMSIGDEKDSADDDKPSRNVELEPAPDLTVTPGLYFCDKDFRPVSAVVLNKLVSGEAGGRVWIMLKLEESKDSKSVDTVTVKMTVDGAPRELILTETGPDTGEFRCGKDGILIVANEDPDSNSDDEAKQKPPRPRFTTNR